MIDAGVPQMLLEWVGGFVTGEIAFLVLLLLFLLALGAILDIFSAIVLVVPLVLPVAAQFGVHPVHLGIVFLAAMQLGYITPPVGLNLFIASYRFQRPVISLYVSTLPFFAALLLAVVIITFWPWLSLALL
jgi:TRAP-type C4-dicarboxylate transport system permease large subunit